MSTMHRGPRVRRLLPSAPLALAALTLGSLHCGIDLGQPSAADWVAPQRSCEGAACELAPPVEALATDASQPSACVDVAHADGQRATAVVRSAAIARLDELGVLPSWVAVSKPAPCPKAGDAPCRRLTARVDVAALANAKLGTVVLEEQEILAPLEACVDADVCTGESTACATGAIGEQHLRVGPHVSTTLSQSAHLADQGVLDVHVPFHSAVTGGPGVGTTAALLDACSGVSGASMDDVTWSDNAYSEPPSAEGEVLGVVAPPATTTAAHLAGCFSGDVIGTAGQAGSEHWFFSFSMSPDVTSRVDATAAYVGVCAAGGAIPFTVGLLVPEIGARYRDAQLALDGAPEAGSCPSQRIDADSRAFSCALDEHLAAFLRARGLEETFCTNLERKTFARLGVEIGARVSPTALRDVATLVEQTFGAVALASGAVDARFACPADHDVACAAEDLRVVLAHVDWVAASAGSEGLELTFEVRPE